MKCCQNVQLMFVFVVQDSDEDIDALMSAHYKTTRSVSSAQSVVLAQYLNTFTHIHITMCLYTWCS